MRPDVLIPWRGGCPHRERALDAVAGLYRGLGWRVVLGGCPDGPWRKALAVADALAGSRSGVLVVADADCWAPGVPAAARAVVSGAAAWAVPHRGVYRLTEQGTGAWLAGERWGGDPAAAPLAERPYRGVEGGGVTVLRREGYGACPLDPRFEGWGSEDESWGWALRALLGPPWRPVGHAPLTHLWHPEPERATRAFGSLAGRDLRKRYARVRGDAAGTRALLGEVVEGVAG